MPGPAQGHRSNPPGAPRDSVMPWRVLFRSRPFLGPLIQCSRAIASGEWAHLRWLARNSDEAQESIRGFEEAARERIRGWGEQGPVKVHAGVQPPYRTTKRTPVKAALAFAKRTAPTPVRPRRIFPPSVERGWRLQGEEAASVHVRIASVLPNVRRIRVRAMMPSCPTECLAVVGSALEDRAGPGTTGISRGRSEW